jgi:hypothetical protein
LRFQFFGDVPEQTTVPDETPGKISVDDNPVEAVVHKQQQTFKKGV